MRLHREGFKCGQLMVNSGALSPTEEKAYQLECNVSFSLSYSLFCLLSLLFLLYMFLGGCRQLSSSLVRCRMGPQVVHMVNLRESGQRMIMNYRLETARQLVGMYGTGNPSTPSVPFISSQELSELLLPSFDLHKSEPTMFFQPHNIDFRCVRHSGQ